VTVTILVIYSMSEEAKLSFTRIQVNESDLTLECCICFCSIVVEIVEMDDKEFRMMSWKRQNYVVRNTWNILRVNENQ
jgi:hypothetical protein